MRGLFWHRSPRDTSMACREGAARVEVEFCVDVDALQEGPFVADHDDCPLVRVEGLDEVILRVEVDVICRLIQHKQLRNGLGEQNERQHRPEPFPAGERPDGTGGDPP